MKSLEDKLETIQSFIEKYERFTFSDGSAICLKIKGSFWVDSEDIKDKLNAEYTRELIDEINIDGTFSLFMQDNIEDFFEFAKEKLLENNLDYEVYGLGRSGGYLSIDGLYQELEEFVEEIEKDIEGIGENLCFHYADNRRELHEIVNKKIEEIEKIENIFNILLEQKNYFENNIESIFIDRMKDELEFEKENIKDKIKKYNNILLTN